MKTNSKLIAACFMTIVAAACTKEGANKNLKIRSFEPISISGTSSQESKTHIGEIDGGAVKIYWNEGDALSLFSTNDGMEHLNIEIPSTSVSGTSAQFYGEVEAGTTDFVAIYPYASAATYNSGVISTVIPTTQSATSGSFANGAALCIASGTRTPGSTEVSGLNFSSLCSVIGFTLPSNIDFAQSVTISAKSGAKLAGSVSINCETAQITSVSEGSITLSGDFVGGNTYYATIAPGTYANGFNFSIGTKGGNTYSRETTKTVEAAAGGVYPLGTLSLAITSADFGSSISIAHKIDGGILNGSTAKFSLAVNKEEFASIAIIKSASISLKQGSSEIATLSCEGAPVEKAMTNASGIYYIPKGEYSYEGTVTYTVNNGTKDIERTASISGTATSPQVSGISFQANLSAYTSYSTYKGLDGRTASTSGANSEDGSTIYGINASYKSGLSSEVYNQCSSLLSVKSTLDGAENSGNVDKQSWAAHTIGAKITFDGASFTATNTKTVHVTGLPYNQGKSVYGDGMNNGEWVQKSGGKYEINNNPKYLRIGSNGNVTMTLNIPSDINTNISYRIDEYLSSRFNYCKTRFIAGGTTILDTEDGGTATTKKYESNKDIIFTSSANSVIVSQNNGNTPTWGSSHPQLYYISILYK